MNSIISLLLLGVASATQWDAEFTLEQVHNMDTLSTFKAWASAFDRSYTDVVEESHRFMVWLDNLYTIASTNSQGLSYKFGLNQFSDMNSDEFLHYIHGDEGSCFKPSQRTDIFNLPQVVEEDLIVEPVSAPASVDWTTKGVVTPVKDQKQCGSCWSFSATGAMECGYAIKHSTLNSLSEQQLVDCDKKSHGCNGGNMQGAMQYAQQNGGLCLESKYPYTARDGSCKASSCGTKYDKPSGVSNVAHDSSSALESAVAQECVSIAIEADQSSFQHYKSGILKGGCGTRTDHGVLVVGYGGSGDQQYWKVKNSWGKSWGMNGYVLLCRNCNQNGNKGECGILTDPSKPNY